jgi:hypothetical protein
VTAEPALDVVVADAVDALFGEAIVRMPTAGPDLVAWCRALAGGASPNHYFLHAKAFPAVHLGDWAREVAGGAAPDLRRDIIQSTVAGYYFVRMIDDVTDDGSKLATRLLPTAGFLHHAFEHPYHSWFPHGHPFWSGFAELWARSAEASTADLSPDAIDERRFVEISARKVIGALIPVSAVFHAHDASVPAEWTALVELLAQYHQLSNDLAGWQGDLTAGRNTWFLSRWRASGVPTALDWWLDEGLAWAQEQRSARMRELIAAATTSGSPGVLAWVRARAEEDQAMDKVVRTGLRALREFRVAMRQRY